MVEIALTTPVEWHGKMVAHVGLREPRGADLLDFGEPRILAKTGDGALFWAEDRAAIKAYLERCLDIEGAPHFLRLLAIADVVALKGKLFDFFDGAPKTSAA